jgi:hypothetical protein
MDILAVGSHGRFRSMSLDGFLGLGSIMVPNGNRRAGLVWSEARLPGQRRGPHMIDRWT